MLKFHQNKISLYLGVGYLILGFITIFSLIPANILLGLTTAGLFFSLSLLCSAAVNTLTPKEKLSRFAFGLQKESALYDLKTIRHILEKQPRFSEIYRWISIAEGICFMLGFVFLVALPGLPLDEANMNRLTTFSYISSIGLVFISFYLEERQSEKTQKEGEMEIVSQLFDRLESSLDPEVKVRTISKGEIIEESEKEPETKAIETDRQAGLKNAFSSRIHPIKPEMASVKPAEKELEIHIDPNKTDKADKVYSHPEKEQPAKQEQPAPTEIEPSAKPEETNSEIDPAVKDQQEMEPVKELEKAKTKPDQSEAESETKEIEAPTDPEADDLKVIMEKPEDIAPADEKSEIEPEEPENSEGSDSSTNEEELPFLNTVFPLEDLFENHQDSEPEEIKNKKYRQ